METLKNVARVEFNKIVNVAEDGAIDVLSDIFVYRDNFHGATGSTFYPVSIKEYKARTTKKAVIEYLEGAVPEDEIVSKWANDTAKNPLQNGLNNWYKAIKKAGEIEELVFDTSYSYLWDYLRATLNLNDKQAYIFECVGGGRMFDVNYQGNFNPELSTIIRKYESNKFHFYFGISNK